jgi:AbrB family looped-hinge helix DNA binding protein
MGLVDEHGRITIDKAIRDELGIRAGDETVQHVEDGRIVVEVVPGRHRRSLVGVRAAGASRRADGPARAGAQATDAAPDPDRPTR